MRKPLDFFNELQRLGGTRKGILALLLQMEYYINPLIYINIFHPVGRIISHKVINERMDHQFNISSHLGS